MNEHIVVDLFCGSGMFTLGAIKGYDKAVAEQKLSGRIKQFIAVNHWNSAAATYEANHPLAQVYCQKIDAVNPREAVPGGRVDLLLASPECTHHSNAAGGRPKNEQSRALAFDALNWMYALYIPLVIFENVPEWEQWGPLTAKGQPVERLKGQSFLSLVEQIKALDYRVEWKVLDASDYGGATSRKRLFMMCKRTAQGPIVWPEPTHGSAEQVAKQKYQPTMFSIGEPLKPKRTAREIIDWSLKGQSIFNRKTPLAPNTMKRIMAGLFKFGLKGFMVEAGGTQGKGRHPHPVDEPMGTILTENHTAIVEPFVLGQQSCAAPRQVDNPLPTIATAGAISLIEPCLIQFNNHCDAVSLDRQVPTLTACGHLGVMQPFVVNAGGPTIDPRSTEMPLNTIVTKAHLGLVQPFLTEVSHGLGDLRAYPVNEGLRTITTVHNQGLVEPYLIEYHGTAPDGRERVAALNTGLPTVDCGNRFGLCDPYILAIDQQGSRGDTTRPMSEQIPTITTKNRLAIAEPYLIKYYGQGENCESINRPLDTVTTHERFALCLPIVSPQGQGYLLLDILFRMLEPHELAAAMGVPETYRFVSIRPGKKHPGKVHPMIANCTRRDAVKMIGNGVSVDLVSKLAYAHLVNSRMN